MKKERLINLVVLLAVCLTTMAAAQEAVETEYLAILLEGKKIGHAAHTRTIEGAKVTTSEQLTMTLGRGGQAVRIQSAETHIETLDGRPLGFEMTLNMSGIQQKHIGEIADGKATITTEVMGQQQQLVIDWPKGALLNQGMRLLQEKHGLKEGAVYEAEIFRPDMRMAIRAQVSIGKPTTVDLFGRVVDLTEVKVTMQVPGQPITVDRKSTRLNSSHSERKILSRMPSSA